MARLRLLSACAAILLAAAARRLPRPPSCRWVRARSTSNVSAVDLALGVRWTAIDREGGPWRVNVLSIDRTVAAAPVRGVLSNRRVAGLERPTAMGRRSRAIAGVNGGFFAVDGDPVGALAIGGRLLSEPVDGRSALIVPADPAQAPRVARTEFAGSVRVGADSRISRRRGAPARIRARVRRPRRATVPPSGPTPRSRAPTRVELVLLSSRYGGSPPITGVEASVRAGEVTQLGRPTGRRVPRGGLRLTGDGRAGRFLKRVLPVGSRPVVDLAVRAGGRPLSLAGQALVTGGGPRLLTDGRVSVAARPEGFAPLEAPGFFGSFVASRQPRTLAGVRADGRLLLVTVDGRRPGWSVGVTLPEAARVMRSLGARDALNLDGGGSSAMVVRGELVSRPSDRSGERAVSDGIFAGP